MATAWRSGGSSHAVSGLMRARGAAPTDGAPHDAERSIRQRARGANGSTPRNEGLPRVAAHGSSERAPHEAERSIRERARNVTASTPQSEGERALLPRVDAHGSPERARNVTESAPQNEERALLPRVAGHGSPERAPHEAVGRAHDAASSREAPEIPPGARTELALPRLGSHLVLRLSDAPVQLAPGARVEHFGHAVVLASRTTAWRRVLDGPAESVGLELAPWELEPLLGVSAGELAGQHHALEPLARSLRERLLEAPPHARAAMLQAWADERLAKATRRAPASIVAAWTALRAGARVHAVVAAAGASHRHFAALFHRWTALLPGEARGLARFARAVQALSRGGVPLADLADEAGYADQSHLTRDLRARCGLSPAQLAAAAPFVPGHLDEGQLRSRRVTDRVRRSRA